MIWVSILMAILWVSFIMANSSGKGNCEIDGHYWESWEDVDDKTQSRFCVDCGLKQFKEIETIHKD